MTTVKKIAALGLAVLMTASLAACSMGGDTKWAAKAGDLTVPAGVYINELITAYSDATVDLPSDVKDPAQGAGGRRHRLPEGRRGGQKGP